MKKNKIQIRIKFFIAAFFLLAGIFAWQLSAQAVGLEVGTSTLILGSGENLIFGNVNSGSNANSNLLMLQNGGTPSMVFKSTGQLGIRISDPWTYLSVLDTISVGINSTKNGNMSWLDDGYFRINSYGNETPVLINEFLYINSDYTGNGSVGVGTQEPRARLEVKNRGEVFIRASGAGRGDNILGFEAVRDTSTWGVDANGFRIYRDADMDDGRTNNLKIDATNSTGHINTIFSIDGERQRIGIGTTVPQDSFSIGSSGGESAPGGSPLTGHNYSGTYLSTDRYALTNYAIVETLIAAATSSLVVGGGTNFWGGTLNGNIWNGAAGVGNVGIGTTAPSSKMDITTNSLGTVITNTSGLSLVNTTAAANAAQQMSPVLRFRGQGWASTGGTSQTDEFLAYVLPVQGTTNSSVNFILASSIAGGAYAARLTLTSAGALTTASAAFASGMTASTGGFTGAVTTTQSLTTTPTNGLAATAAAALVGTPVRISPSVIWSGSAWNTTPTAATKVNAIEAYLLPVTGAVTSGSLVFSNRTVNGIANATELMRITTAGRVSIGGSAPNDSFSIGGSGGTSAPAGSPLTGHNHTSTYLSDDGYALTNYAIVESLIAAATGSLAVSGNYLPLSGGTMTGDVNFGNQSITNLNNLTVSKITATTIDPLYHINGVNYSTYAPSISGGVKEELTGKAKITRRIESGEYEYIINFLLEDEGSDLWLWRKVVDYSDDNVQVFITPSGKFADVYYIIEGNKLIFRADRPVEISYRLIGNRFDWRVWPTKAIDQSQKGVIVR